MSVDDDYAIVDVPQDRQHRDVRVRQAMLQAVPLHRVFKDRLLTFDRNVIDANVGLCAGAYGCDAAVFAVFGCKCDDGMHLQRADNFGQRPA